MDTLIEFQKDKIPEKTNIKCFHCCHDFDTQPLPMPFLYIKGVFHVKYNFCSWECMKTFNNEINSSTSPQTFSLISLFQRNVFNVSTKEFAPSKYTLKCFGGHLTIDEFRNTNNKSYKILEYPYVVSNPKIEQKNNFSWIQKSSAEKQYDNFNRSTATESSTVKLKRNKETKTTKTLENVMGLMRMSDTKS